MINHDKPWNFGKPDFQTNPNLANGASASGFTLPPLHPLHPFARWARRARRRSPAAAAKLRLLHPIHREAFFLSKVGGDSGPQSYQHVPILKVIAVIALLHLLIMSWIGYLESPTLERGAPWMGKWQNGNGVIVPPFCQMIHLIVFSRRSSCLVPPRAGWWIDLRAMSHYTSHFFCS